MALADYEGLKFDLAALLRDYAAAPGASATMKAELLSRLARDRFNLVTVGRFSRGKSSLMNALLGATFLPMGIVPLTSVITIVKYGSETRATLCYPGTNLFMDVPLAELPRHITERGNPGNREGISHVEIDVPAELLRYGFRFIDTPGLGSSIMANTRTTQAFLKEADAFLVVTGFDAPLATEELAVLHEARRAGQRMFLVVNKQDLLTDDDRAVVLDHIRSRLDAEGLNGVDIHAISALRALEGMRDDNMASMAASGIEALRSALIRFMVDDKAKAFLTSMVGRVDRLLGPAAVPDTRARLDVIARQIETVTRHDAEPGSVIENILVHQACPICTLVSNAVFDTIAGLQHRLGHDEARRRAFAGHETLCPPHAWQFSRIAAQLSVVSSLADAIGTMAARLQTNGRDPTPRRCPVCAAAQRAQAEAIATLTDHPGTVASLICLPHFPLLMSSMPESRRCVARDAQATMMKRVVEDMRRFMLKREGQERHALTREENAAAHAAICLIAGDPNAFPPQPSITELTPILADRNDVGE